MAKEIKEEQKKLADFWNQKFKDARAAKQPYTDNWEKYLTAWDNSLYEDSSAPDYRSNYITNYIYSTIESMRPIMFDGNVKFEALPVTKEALRYCSAINTAFDFELNRTHMKQILMANAIYTLAIGTSVIMLNYGYDKPGMPVDGDVEPIAVNPFNIFPDPLATSVEDAEFIIYASYHHKNELKNLYPEYADLITGSSIQYSELVNKRDEGWRTDTQVLVIEVWCRDYTEIEITNDRGEIEQQPKFPRGRVITIAPELSLILEDKENPYESGRFPFFLFKDIEIPFKFWGEGEAKWLLSPQEAINALQNQIIDNAKHTANAQWIMDKNCGIAKGEITNRPGLIIRKNPGTDVHRESPPAMPMYVSEMISRMEQSIETISGVHDVTRGQTPTGIESGSAIQILQEAAQTRIRMKISLFEEEYSALGNEWLMRIKQFWKSNRLIPIKKTFSENVPQMQLNGMEMQQKNPMNPPVAGQQMQMDNTAMQNNNFMTGISEYDFVEVGNEQLINDYRIKVVANTCMQTSSASMLETMTSLIKLPAEDGLPIVTREAVLDYLPEVNKEVILDYFNKIKQERIATQQQQMMNNQMAQQLQQTSQITGELKQRADKEDQQAQQDQYMIQGYNQGMSEGMMLKQQMDKKGDIPPALLQQLANMDTKELAQFIQQNPDIVSLLPQG